MATTNIYLNFTNQTEAAFNFYKTVFGGEFEGGVHRFGEIPPQEGMPPLDEADKQLVMHVSLPILGGVKLMGTDAPASMGFTVQTGNNVHISLHPDSRAEANRLFTALSAGGRVDMPLQDMFWGAYYGSFADQFGVQWMINYETRIA
jgi:PhnB protein